MISETARSRPNVTSSHNEAPTGADNTSTMMRPLPDLDRLKGPQDRLCCLLLCMRRRVAEDYGQAGRGFRSDAQSVRQRQTASQGSFPSRRDGCQHGLRAAKAADRTNPRTAPSVEPSTSALGPTETSPPPFWLCSHEPR